MMKYISLSLLVLIVAFTACKKEYQEDTHNFYNTLPPYVELKSKTTINTKEDSTIRITVQMRTALQEPVDVNYTITGSVNRQGTIRINRNTLESTVTVPVPVGTIPLTQTTGTAEVRLTTAKTVTSNSPLTVGRTGTEKEKISVNIRR